MGADNQQRAPMIADATTPGSLDAGDVSPSAAWSAFTAAWQAVVTAHAADLVEQHIQLARRNVCIRVVGAQLATMLFRPFNHLQTGLIATEPTALCIDLWDEAAVGTPVQLVDFVHASDVPYGLCSVSPDGGQVWYKVDGMTVVYDRVARRAIGYVAAGANLPLHFKGKPLRELLALWLGDQGSHQLHAALVAQDDAGILVGGLNGAGKSTTALACVQAGWAYLGDDVVGLDYHQDGYFEGHSFYNSAFYDHDQLFRFPELRHYISYAGQLQGNKNLLMFTQQYVHQQSSTRIRVITLPRIKGGATQITRAAPKDALRVLAPSSLHLHRPAAHATLERLAQLVQAVPAYWLEVGDDLHRIPRRLEHVMAEVSCVWGQR